MFSWLNFSQSADDRQVQMNPAVAMQQGTTLNTVRKLVGGVVMFAIAVVIAGGAFYFLQNGSATNASFNYKQSLYGTVASVDTVHNSFLLTYDSSVDARIESLGKTQFTILLPPGTSFADTAAGKTCATVPDLNEDLSAQTASTCSLVVKPGGKLIIEYLFITSSTGDIVAKTILGQK